MQLQLIDNQELQQESTPHYHKIQKELELYNRYRFKFFYKPREVATLLGLSYFQVFYAIKKYHLDAVRIGWIWRIPFNAIIRYIEDQEYCYKLEDSFYQWISSREQR